MSNLVTFVVPPTTGGSVVSDYAAGIGFEPQSDYHLPPLDLIQLAAVTRSKFDVRLFDFAASPATSIQSAIDELASTKSAAFVVQAAIPTLEMVLTFCRSLRKKGTRTIMRVQYLEPSLIKNLEILEDDEWLLGECEEEVIDILNGSKSQYHFFGKNIQSNSPSKIGNLQPLPHPAHDLLNDVYCYPRLGKCFTILTSKGCPFSCGYYCPYPLVQGKAWRSRPINQIIVEIRSAISSGLPKRVLFRDPVFTLNAGRTQDFCTEIVNHSLGISWWCETRVDLLTNGVIEQMAKAGCVGVNLGIETGDEELRLGVLKGKVTNQRVRETCRTLRQNNIAYSLLLMCGWPTETSASLLKTGELIAELKPTSAGVVFPTAYPGTQFHSDLVASNRLDPTATPTSGAIPQVPSDHLSTEQLLEAHGLITEIATYAATPEKFSSELDNSVHNLRQWAELNQQMSL